VAWDGIGLGTDGSLWGGEFLQCDYKDFVRLAHFRTFPLPGGEAAIREPRRSAIGALFEIFGNRLFSVKEFWIPNSFSPPEKTFLEKMLCQNIQCPRTSSVGRLFDAVTSLLGLCQVHEYEGQGAMALQYLAETKIHVQGVYPIALQRKTEPWILDWELMILGILSDMREGLDPASIAIKFHHSLAQAVTLVASHLPLDTIALGGGCFQNRLLSELIIEKLKNSGKSVYWPEQVPPNDGGLSLGQAVITAHQIKEDA